MQKRRPSTKKSKKQSLQVPWYKSTAFFSAFIGGICLIVAALIAKLHKEPNQKVDWQRDPSGMVIDHKYEYLPWPKAFIEWDKLKNELEKEIFPLLEIDSSTYTIRLVNRGDKKNGFIEIITKNDTNVIAHIWLGWNPWTDGEDGLIRVGTPGGQKRTDFKQLWGTFQRNTDGHYHTLHDLSVPDSLQNHLK